MTALSSPRHRNFASHHDPRRLLAAAIVGSVGVIVLSVAFGQFVVASRPNVAVEGRSLLAGIPAITALGIGHLLVAFGLASGGRTARHVAQALTGVAAATVGALVLLGATAVGPRLAIATPHVTGSAVGMLLVLGALYAVATILGRSDRALD
ncbi:MAG: hypothetical protein ACJ77U_01540 [Chloroflexota bacterium]